MKTALFTPVIFTGLLERARDGCRDALNTILGPFCESLRKEAEHRSSRALRAYCHPSEIRQITLLNAVKFFPAFKGTTIEQLEAWLRTTMRHVLGAKRRAFQRVREHQRSLKYWYLEPGEEDEGPLEFADLQALEPDAHAFAVERARAVLFAISMLPSPLDRLCLMHFFEEMSWKQIASHLNCDAKAVRTMSRVANDRLRGILEMFDFPDWEVEAGPVSATPRLRI
jgi:RNA polymerase sigma factor (sigma-70 family)